MTELVYLYAVMAGAPPDAAIEGIDGRQVRYVNEGELSGVVSDVPADEFDSGPLNELIKDMGWLAPRAVAHQDVNDRLFANVEAVVPLAFGSVFLSDERVQALLHRQAAAFLERLEIVRGRSEWVVAVHRVADPEPGALDEFSPAVRELRAEVQAASPGRAHLLRRRLEQLERDEQWRIDADVIADVMGALNDNSDDLFREVIPTDALDRPLLRSSVLVPRAGEAAFLGVIERLEQRWSPSGYRVLLTGPWPPYRFAGLDSAEQHVAAH